MSVLGRLVAFFDNVWSFILTLVRSLIALLSFRRRTSSDPFALPSVNRTPKDAIARAQSRLRPILLTPRSIARVPVPYPQRTQTVRTGSAATAVVAPGPQRTSPKLDPDPDEPAVSAAVPESDQEPATSADSQGTPDTSLPTTHTTSLSVQPLTPPDRCYLAPMPSRTDCPYTEPWPSNDAAPDRNSKSRLQGSPLKASAINTDPTFTKLATGHIGSPPPAHWSPAQIWTTTSEDDHEPAPVSMPDPAISPFDSADSPLDPSSALANISHALISRSHSSVEPYDAASTTTTTESSDASLFVNASNEPAQQPDHHDDRADNEHFAQFHRPEAYVRAWRVPGRQPGKPSDRTSVQFTTARSYSHAALPAVSEWYDADAYVPSPMSGLSPPQGESATEDEDEMPLGRLRERLTFRSRHSLAVPLDVGRKTVGLSPRSRRMSEGCLLAISESTPTRVGIGARPRRKATAMALEDEDMYGYKDWLEALSLRYPSEDKDALASATDRVPSHSVAA